MADELKTRSSEAVRATRRDFVRSSAQVAMTAPAVALLLSAATQPAAGQTIFPYCACGSHILDDFTFGNINEDLDAIALQSNFNPFNQVPQLDDHI